MGLIPFLSCLTGARRKSVYRSDSLLKMVCLSDEAAAGDRHVFLVYLHVWLPIHLYNVPMPACVVACHTCEGSVDRQKDGGTSHGVLPRDSH